MTQHAISLNMDWRKGTSAIADIIIPHLRSNVGEWQSVYTDDLSFEDLTGVGGGQTFKVA